MLMSGYDDLKYTPLPKDEGLYQVESAPADGWRALARCQSRDEIAAWYIDRFIEHPDPSPEGAPSWSPALCIELAYEFADAILKQRG